MKNCLNKFYASGKYAALALLVWVGTVLVGCGEEAPESPEFYAVDLGLSVDWAWCNMGATYPEEDGTLFEAAENDFSDITDLAYIDLGEGWRIPTEAEMRELVEKCKWTRDVMINAYGNEVYGITAKGPNGNKIFFPSATRYHNNSGRTVYGPMPYATGNWDLRLFTVNNEDDYYNGFDGSDFSPSLRKETREAFLENSIHYFYIRPVKSETPFEEETPDNDEIYTVGGVSFKMIKVEGGAFTMGATSEQGSDVYDDEFPTHQVTLSDYAIGETEVTQALWQAVMGSNPSYSTGNMQRPVECVTWDECQAFISKLNALTGEHFCLPTEAEWEYAARGGCESKGYKYSGSNTLSDVAWYENNSPDGTHAVKTKQPNELGIYDMSGNVYEWCSDWFGSYHSYSQTNPTGPSSGSNRALRGGSWSSEAEACRVAYRGYDSPENWGNNGGLRLVRH